MSQWNIIWRGFRIIDSIPASVHQVSVGSAGEAILYFYSRRKFLCCKIFLPRIIYSALESMLFGVGWTLLFNSRDGHLSKSIRICYDGFVGGYVNNVGLTVWSTGFLLQLLGGIVLQPLVVVFSIMWEQFCLRTNSMWGKTEGGRKETFLMTKAELLYLPIFIVTFIDLPSYMIQWTSPPCFIHFREVSVTGCWVFWFIPTPAFSDWQSSCAAWGLPFNFSQTEFLHPIT